MEEILRIFKVYVCGEYRKLSFKLPLLLPERKDPFSFTILPRTSPTDCLNTDFADESPLLCASVCSHSLLLRGMSSYMVSDFPNS